MITYLVSFLLALMVSLVMTLVVRNRAHAYGWVEQVGISSRKVHRKPIPRLGGVAIILGFFAPLVALLFVESRVGQIYRSRPDVIIALFCGSVVIAALGLYDDFKGANAAKKFAVQFAVAIGLWLAGFRIEKLATPLIGSDLELGMMAFPITLIWVVGVINAMNLIDGLDGLAGGVAFFAVGTNFLLAFTRGDVLMSLMMAALAGAVLGFLVFNFNPASIFMGDTGSMFLGFVLAASSLKTSQKGGTAVALLVPVLALGLPIMDTLLAVSRRAVRGRPVFSADKEHIHHRLMSRLSMTHRRAVLVLYGVSCLFALVALGLAYANSAQSAMLLAGTGIVVLVLMRKLGYMNIRDAQGLPMIRQRNLQLRAFVRESTVQLRTADELIDMWNALRPIAENLNAARLLFELHIVADATREAIRFESVRDAGTALPLEIYVDVCCADVRVGRVTVFWRDGRDEVDRDEELALEMLADALGAAIARQSARQRLQSLPRTAS